MARDGRRRLGAAMALTVWLLAWGAGPQGGMMGLFADDDTAQYVFARFIAHAFEGALIHHLRH